MGLGELIGMRWILWGDGPMPKRVTVELERLIRCILEAPERGLSGSLRPLRTFRSGG
jgi:hypothetical protein